jgi:aminoglycoside 6'-N-acetyltransferase
VRIELTRAEVPTGESWAQAADRLARGRGPVLAEDLSGDPLRFCVDDVHRFAVRPMTEGDFADVSRWVNAPHVAVWWDEHRTPEQVAAHYTPGIHGEDAVRYWIWEANGRSVGFSQDYRIADHPEFALLCGHPDAIGFDYVVGETAFVDRGLGTRLLWVFLRDIVVPAYGPVTELFAAPDHRNTRSLRVLAKLGATQGLWFDEPQSDGSVETVVGCSIDVRQVLRWA